MIVQSVKEVGVPASGGGFCSVKGIFSKVIKLVNVNPVDEDWLNGIIPDLKIDGRTAVQLPDRPTKIHGVVTLGEVKGLAKVSETVAHRAGRINSDIKKSAAALDAKYPGSTVSTELMKYGKDGEYLALVTGSLGNCSADVLVIVDFIAGNLDGSRPRAAYYQRRSALQHIPPLCRVLLRPIHYAPLGSPHPRLLSRCRCRESPPLLLPQFPDHRFAPALE
jgi:hypothetical protein